MSASDSPVEAWQRHTGALLAFVARRGREAGLSLVDVATLELVGALGERATPSALAEALALPSGSMTTVLHRLEERRFVVRRPHPSDGRSSVIAMGPKAVAFARAELVPTVTALGEEADTWSVQARRAFVRGLDACADILDGS